jgi:hypothetical protein
VAGSPRSAVSGAVPKPGRGWVLLVGAGVLVAGLVGGRWAAMETAERLWAATIPQGDVYLAARSLARPAEMLLWIGALAWGVGHLYAVYRAIGSVQMPRRLGDIEIVEAVPHRLLLTVTLASGVLYAAALVWAAGDLWHDVALASASPHFGITEPVLHRDLGYYVGELPWADTRQGILFLAALSALILTAALYTAIGSLRLREGRVATSPHARTHLAVVLAVLASAVAWGALLDPAELVAGLHGPLDQAAIAARIPGSFVIAGAAVAAALMSGVWAWWNRPALVGGAWGTLLVVIVTANWIIPSALRSTSATKYHDVNGTPYSLQRAEYEQLAFEAAASDLPLPRLAPGETLAAIPLWDPQRIMARARDDRALGAGTTPTGVALEAAGSWLVGLAPDGAALARVVPVPTWDAIHRGLWAHVGAPLRARETDTTVAFSPVSTASSTTWFGPGFTEFAVADSAASTGGAGIPLTGLWHRLALAWVLQSPELAQDGTAGGALLWRRDVGERLADLAPFADFEPASPVMVNDSLWWLAWGYVSSATFPLVRGDTWNREIFRYRRAGLVGAVNATTGVTHLWLATDPDSLSAAWARIYRSLIEPPDRMPREFRSALSYPAAAFHLAAPVITRALADSAGWVSRPADPFLLVAPAPDDPARPAVWTAQAFERRPADKQRSPDFAALVAGVVTPRGRRLYVWPQPPATQLPASLAGDAQRRVGVFRVWPTTGGPLTVQGRFVEPEHPDVVPSPPRLDSVFLSLGSDQASGPTVDVALRQLLRGPAPPVDTTVAARLRRVRALFASLDSALARRDMVTFGRLYDSLATLLGTRRRAVASPQTPR